MHFCHPVYAMEVENLFTEEGIVIKGLGTAQLQAAPLGIVGAGFRLIRTLMHVGRSPYVSMSFEPLKFSSFWYET